MGHSVRLLRVMVMVHRRRLQAGVTVRVSSSRQGLRLGLGLARHDKKLGLSLGLPPVARGRYRVTDRVTCRRQGRSCYPESCAAARATGNGSDSWR